MSTFSLMLPRPRTAATVLGAIAAMMVAMHLLMLAMADRWPLQTAELFMSRFDLEEELTAPAWFSAAMLLACAPLLVWIGLWARRTGRPDGNRWIGLGCLFVLLSADEAASFHELLGPLVRDNLNVGGLFYYAWVIPGILFCIVLAAIYLPALLRWPARTRWLSIAAAVIFVSGAIGLEMIGGAIAQQHGRFVASYRVAVVIEESLEMIGVIVFIYALLDYLWSHVPAAPAEG